MAAVSKQVEYSVQMLISDWLLIDGTLDNHVQSAIDDAVPDGMDEEAQDGDGRDEDAGWDEGSGGDTEAEMEIITELPRVARSGTGIRQAGWDQIPGWPHDAEGFRTWPAPGQSATMTLAGAQWNLVVSALYFWADVDERLSDAERAAESRTIAAAITRRLAEQGWSPESL